MNPVCFLLGDSPGNHSKESIQHSVHGESLKSRLVNLACSKHSREILKYKICPVAAELFHADRRRDRHDEANCRLSQFCESA